MSGPSMQGEPGCFSLRVQILTGGFSKDHPTMGKSSASLLCTSNHLPSPSNDAQG